MHASEARARSSVHTEIKVSERVTIAHAGDLWCHYSRVTDRFVTLDKDYFIMPTAQEKMYQVPVQVN